jgi:hypothetical protein
MTIILSLYTPTEKETNDKRLFKIIGKAKNLVEMWKTMDKENTPPPERRGPRAITPPPDNERHLPPPEDVIYILHIKY